MSSIADRAKAFEATCPRQTRNLNGQEWTYYLGGSGDPLLLLTGGTGIGIAWADLVVGLQKGYRILAIDYPAIPSFIGLADGLSELLEAEDSAEKRLYLLSSIADLGPVSNIRYL